MILQTKYDINQYVVIQAIDIWGTVVGIRLEGRNLIYKIEYWVDGKVQVVDQDEWQIRDLTSKESDKLHLSPSHQSQENSTSKNDNFEDLFANRP